MLLGKLLLQLRLVTPVQLDAALRAQVAHGGRLGTNLLRLGYIEPDSLTAALAKQLDVRGVSMQKLSRLDELTLKRIPAAVARRNRALPLGLVDEGGRRSLCVAFADPRDLASMDEVAFACGLPVVPFVAPELCVQTYLDEYYGIEGEEEAQDSQQAPAQMAQGQGGAQSAPSGRVVALRPKPEPAAPQRNDRGQQGADYWTGQQGMQHPVARSQSVTQGFRSMSTPEARSLEQALRVAGDDGSRADPRGPGVAARANSADAGDWEVPSVTRQPAAHPADSDYWGQQPPHRDDSLREDGGRPQRNLQSRSERHEEMDYPPPRRQQREAPAVKPTREHQSPLYYGAPNQTEPPPQPRHMSPSDLELDAPRRFREDDFNLPIPQPRVRELDEGAFDATVGSPRRSRQPSEEVDLSELEAAYTGRGAADGRTSTSHQQARPHPPEVPDLSEEVDAEEYEDDVMALTDEELSEDRGRPALSLDEALVQLQQARSREEIGDIVTDFLRSAFGCGLVFICKDDLCLGWKGFATGTSPSVIESIVLPLSTPSMLRVAYQRGSIFRGAPPKDGGLVQQRLWKMIQSAPPEEVLVAPVKLGKRVVNLIYIHAFDLSHLADAAVIEVSAVTKATQQAFTRLIKSTKQP